MAQNLPLERNNKTPLGVFEDGGKIYLILKRTENNTRFALEASADGITFRKSGKQIEFKSRILQEQELESVNVSVWENRYLACYIQKTGRVKNLFSAQSGDKKTFENVHAVGQIAEEGAIVPDFRIQNNFVLYFGGDSLNVSYSKNLTDWDIVSEKMHSERKGFLGKSTLTVANCILTHQGILVFYWENKSSQRYSHFILRMLLCDIRNPQQILEKFDDPIWETSETWARYKVKPLGVVRLENKLFSYWKVGGRGLFVITHPFIDTVAKIKQNIPFAIIHKLAKNPLLAPLVGNFWESKATFNPAAVFEKNKVHLIYRAVGDDDVSVLGYASSFDGVHFDDRHREPVYIPREPFESGGQYRHKGSFSEQFVSGGGCFGGCEDPRITKVDNKFYMTYVAYNGWSHPRIAVTSISEAAFGAGDWQWEKPVLITKPNVVDKNACILPEKINGKYVIFHRVFPNILIDFVDSLDFDGQTFLAGEHKIEPRKDSWDSRKIGAGPPPVKTPDGWLLIYQAVGNQDPGRYKVGAMLLSLTDPTRVLYRTQDPILEPDRWYENDGFKSGVVYPCGSVILGDRLMVYYGGSDSYVCGASCDINKLIREIKLNHPVYLNPISQVN